MTPQHAHPRRYAFFVVLALLGVLAGCGAKGDLYLPGSQDNQSR